MLSNRTAGRPARGPLLRRHVVALVVVLGVAMTSACGDADVPAAGARAAAPAAGAPADETAPAEETAAAGQQGSGGDVSRVRTYGSLAELAEASALVVTGTVQGRRVVADLPDTDLQFTLADVVVGEVLRGDVEPGAAVVVRQAPVTDAQALQEGGTYLLYLTPSGLDGERAGHYYVTGATAGIYTTDPAAGASARYRRLDADSGDALPAEVLSADALG